MNNQERVIYLKEQLAVLRSYTEPLAIERDELLVAMRRDGFSIEELTELCGYKTVATVKSKITKAGIDWRTGKPITIEPEPEPEPEPAPFVWWV